MASKITKREFLRDIAQIAIALRAQIEAEVAGFPIDEERKKARIERARGDLEFFARTYFPHYVKSANAVLHDYLYQRLPQIVDNGIGDHEAIAAPRGNAKSTIVSLILILWCIVTERKKYLIIIMDALEQALPTLEAIKAELECNPRIMMDFQKACGQGRIWQVGTIITGNDIKVQVFGSGKRLRGLRHGPNRPDLVVCDDLENDENVRSPEQRDKLESWLKKTVLSLGAADDTMDVVVIGTILHYDSVLSRLINNPLWKSCKFRSVIEWPHRMDLWDQWEALLLNEGDQEADLFYQARKTEMDNGAIISWPAAQPLYTLMKKRARDGRQAFDSEQQNDPVSGDDAPFAACIHFWVDRLPEWRFFGACDPSLGKHGASRDPSALLVGGFNRSTGILDVVEAQIKKRLPDKIIEDVIGLQQQYHCVIWVVEAVQFQEFFRTELVKRSAARGFAVPACAITPSADKVLRIETLQPHMNNKLIRVHPSQKTLIDQLRHFPKADHDDGPDALQMLWMAATTRSGKIEYQGAGKSARGHVSRYGYFGGGAW